MNMKRSPLARRERDAASVVLTVQYMKKAPRTITRNKTGLAARTTCNRSFRSFIYTSLNRFTPITLGNRQNAWIKSGREQRPEERHRVDRDRRSVRALHFQRTIPRSEDQSVLALDEPSSSFLSSHLNSSIFASAYSVFRYFLLSIDHGSPSILDDPPWRRWRLVELQRLRCWSCFFNRLQIGTCLLQATCRLELIINPRL